MSRYEKSFLQNDIKYLPVILERNEKAVGNIVMKKYGKEWRIRAEVTSIECVFLYPMPDSSLRAIFCFSFIIIPILPAAQEWRQRWIAFLYDGLICVRQHAPIASQAWHFPRERGKLMVKEERIHIFKKYYLIVAVKIKCKPKAVPACRGRCRRSRRKG